MPEVPSAPWRLRAEHGVALTGWAPAKELAPWWPPELESPAGRVPMILAAARYEGDSTLCYSELVIGVLIRSPGWRLLPLRLLADQEAARRGGERIWGLHKELAEFAWTERPEPRNRKSYELVIRQGDRPVLDLWWMPRWLALPIRAPVPVAGDRPWTLEARARVQRAVHHLSARPPGTPGWLLAWHLSDLELVAPAPD